MAHVNSSLCGNLSNAILARSKIGVSNLEDLRSSKIMLLQETQVDLLIFVDWSKKGTGKMSPYADVLTDNFYKDLRCILKHTRKWQCDSSQYILLEIHRPQDRDLHIYFSHNHE